MKNMTKVIWGVVLLVVGIIFGLNALGVTNIDVWFPGWWTLFIIIPCLVGLFTERDKTGNAIGLIIGVGLLLSQLDIIDFSLVWKIALPAIIIIIAIKLIWAGLSKKDEDAEVIIEFASNPAKGSAIFSGSSINFDDQPFEGADLNAIFGGVECDLSRAIIEKNTEIKFNVIFGGIDITVPKNVNVQIKSTSIFGGVEDKSIHNPDAEYTVYISGVCIFGGVDVQ